MRLLICAGGTGGGVYPALAVLQALANDPGPFLWVGGEEGMEADLVKRSLKFDGEKLSFTAIPAAGVHGVGGRALPGNLVRLARGYAASRRILHQFQPEVLLFTGGYLAVPMALAGRKLPSLTYVPDVEPGLAIKALARVSTHLAVTVDDSQRFFSTKSHLTVTGYPVRPELSKWSRVDAARVFNLQLGRPTLLVAGGSKGARSINRALLAVLPEILKDFQVVHLSGQLDWPEIQSACASLSADLLPYYHAFPYLHEMGAALASADLVVSRAGASTLGEYPLFGLPAVLVPYPYAWRYQRVNAEYLSGHNAAVVIEDSSLSNQLLSTVKSLLGDKNRLESMQIAMRSLSHPQAAAELAAELTGLANQGAKKR